MSFFYLHSRIAANDKSSFLPLSLRAPNFVEIRNETRTKNDKLYDPWRKKNVRKGVDGKKEGRGTLGGRRSPGSGTTRAEVSGNGGERHRREGGARFAPRYKKSPEGNKEEVEKKEPDENG